MQLILKLDQQKEGTNGKQSGVGKGKSQRSHLTKGREDGIWVSTANVLHIVHCSII